MNNLQLAQQGPLPVTNPALGDLGDLAGDTFLQRALSIGITLFFIVGIVIFVFMLLLGGVQWITSQGDKAAVEGARNRIGHAIIGLFILFVVFAVVNLIGAIFNINLLQITIPTLSTS